MTLPRRVLTSAHAAYYIWTMGSDFGCRICSGARSCTGQVHELSSDPHARHLERFSLYFNTTESDVVDRQGRQIVQSHMKLYDLLP